MVFFHGIWEAAHVIMHLLVLLIHMKLCMDCRSNVSAL